jgi:hypothetical protein
MAGHTKGVILRQPGHLDMFKTRRFPSPPHDGFSFIEKVSSTHKTDANMHDF